MRLQTHKYTNATSKHTCDKATTLNILDENVLHYSECYLGNCSSNNISYGNNMPISLSLSLSCICINGGTS